MRLETDGPDLTLRLAALLHDVGKPATKAVGPDGRVSFHHHELVGARMTKQRLKALRFPKDVIADVVELVALHLRFYGYGRGEWTDSAVRRYVTDAGDAAAPAAQADPVRLHHPQPAQGGRARRPTTTRSRSGSPGSPPRRIWPGSGRTWTATRSWSCSGCRPGRWSVRPGSTSRSCASTAARSTMTRRSRRCSRGPPIAGHHAAEPVSRRSHAGIGGAVSVGAADRLVAPAGDRRTRRRPTA